MTAPAGRTPTSGPLKLETRDLTAERPRPHRAPSERLARLMDGVSAIGSVPAQFGVE